VGRWRIVMDLLGGGKEARGGSTRTGDPFAVEELLL